MGNPKPGVAVLGGTFDPIHYGHLKLAMAVRRHLALEEVRLIPSYQPPHRQEPEASADDRLAMLRIAVEDLDGLVADDREVERGGTSYTIHTLESLRDEIGADTPLCFIVGMDAYLTIDKWYRWRHFMEICHLVVLHRPEIAYAEPSESIAALERRHSVERQEKLHCGGAGSVLHLRLAELSVSATAIRAAIRSGEYPRDQLPDRVVQYIQDHGLYRPVE